MRSVSQMCIRDRPETAPVEVLQAFNESYSAIAVSREAEARRFAAILGVSV